MGLEFWSWTLTPVFFFNRSFVYLFFAVTTCQAPSSLCMVAEVLTYQKFKRPKTIQGQFTLGLAQGLQSPKYKLSKPVAGCIDNMQCLTLIVACQLLFVFVGGHNNYLVDLAFASHAFISKLCVQCRVLREDIDFSRQKI